MSLLLLMGDKNNIYMGSDSRQSVFQNGKLKKVHDKAVKITRVHNKTIFTAGLSDILDDVLDEFER